MATTILSGEYAGAIGKLLSDDGASARIQLSKRAGQQTIVTVPSADVYVDGNNDENKLLRLSDVLSTKYTYPVHREAKEKEPAGLTSDKVNELVEQLVFTNKPAQHEINYKVVAYSTKIQKTAHGEYLRGFYLYLGDSADNTYNKVEIYHDIKSLRVVVNYDREHTKYLRSGTKITVDGVELKYSGPTYSYDSPKYLRRDYKNSKFARFVVGELFRVIKKLRVGGVSVGGGFINKLEKAGAI